MPSSPLKLRSLSHPRLPLGACSYMLIQHNSPCWRGTDVLLKQLRSHLASFKVHRGLGCSRRIRTVSSGYEPEMLPLHHHCDINYFSLTLVYILYHNFVFLSKFVSMQKKKALRRGNIIHPLSDPHRGRTVWFVYRSPLSPVSGRSDRNRTYLSQFPKLVPNQQATPRFPSDSKQYSLTTTLQIQEKKENFTNSNELYVTKAHLFTEAGIEPAQFPLKGNVLTA